MPASDTSADWIWTFVFSYDRLEVSINFGVHTNHIIILVWFAKIIMVVHDGIAMMIA